MLSLGGLYIDPNHAAPGTFRGLRLVQSIADGAGGAFVVAGTDDGISWWSVRGRPASDSDSTRATSAVEIDFSPKGGPAAARATFSALTGLLRFADGNGWTRVEPMLVPGGGVKGS